MSNLNIPTWLINSGYGALTPILNKALAYDPSTQQALSELGDFIIEFDISNPSIHGFIIHKENMISFSQTIENEQQTDGKIAAKLSDIVTLIASADKTFANSDITVQGSIHTLNQLSNIFRHLDFDWEQGLCDAFGNIVGMQIASFIRATLRNTKENSAKAAKFTGEYISQEKKLTPSKEELDLFYEHISQLRADTERLEARFNQLDLKND